jgi:cation diffusion facilitator family transporter
MLGARVPTTERTAQIKRVLLGLLLANLAVVVAKFGIWLSSGSLAVLGDGVHSAVDAMNNVLALAVMVIASKQPDEDHPYGHSKFETLGALAIVVFLAVSGFELVKGSVKRLVLGAEPLEIGGLELAILIGTLAVNVVVALYESRRGRDLNSDLLLADASHTKADVGITLAVITGVLLSRAGLGFADPIVALVVAGAIATVAYRITRRAVPVLVDEHAAPTRAIRTAVEGVEGVKRAYHIRSRGSPEQRFTELTIAVDGRATVSAAHVIADAVEGRLRDELSFTHIVVHVEPC